MKALIIRKIALGMLLAQAGLVKAGPLRFVRTHKLAIASHVAAAFDGYTTNRFLVRGFKEENPLVRPFAHPGWQPYVVLQVPPIVYDVLSYKGHTKVAKWLRIATIVSNVGFGAANLRLSGPLKGGK